MNEIPFCILWCNDVHNLIHIKQNPITNCCLIVSVMASDEVLDFREGFLNWIEVGGVWRKVLDSHTCEQMVC